jgi:hypothetical protein
MNLPIDIVPGPMLIFRWRHTTTSPVGPRTIEHEGAIGASVDGAIAALISVAKELDAENRELRQRLKVMAGNVETLEGKITSMSARPQLPSIRKKEASE